MDELRDSVHSHSSLLSETLEKQQPKHQWFGAIICMAYILLPVFEPLPDETEQSVRTCTAILPTVSVKAYCWLELTICLCLIISRHYLQISRINPFKPAYLTLSLTIFFFIALTNFLWFSFNISLVLRVPMLLACSKKIRQLFRVYFRIIGHNVKYYFLMWLSIIVFWAAGQMLFGGQDLDNEQNMFRSAGEIIWSLLVLQSTANYPDVSLPYVDKNITSMAFFVAFLLCNTIAIANMIIANGYNVYKEVTEKYELREGLPKTLLIMMNKRQKKLRQSEAFREMPKRSKTLRMVVEHPIYKLNEWMVSLALFVITCFHPIKQFPNALLYCMVAMTILLSFSPFVRFFTMPIKLAFGRPFLIYDVLVVILTLIVSAFIMFEDKRLNFLYPYFALLRIPHIFKPILQLLFKDELASSNYTNPSGKVIIETHYRFLPRLMNVFYTLFLVASVFGGIGILLFSGLIRDDDRDRLDQHGINPKYVFLNFNSVISSLMTLFCLLIVNNWNAIVEMYVFLTGTRTSRLFFIAFYLFGVLVAYNIVVASIIECVVMMAQRKKANAQQKSKDSSENVKESVVKLVRNSLALKDRRSELDEAYLMSCIQEQLQLG